jgi:hypothetical protein
MTSQDYRLALDAAIKEYEDLGQQKRALDDRLAQLGQTVGSLTRLLGLTPTVPLGLTDACRMILRRGDPMTPVEVRNRLLAIGIDMSKYANDLAAVHTILKRLSASGELRFIPGAAGKHQYAWNQMDLDGGRGCLQRSRLRSPDACHGGCRSCPGVPQHRRGHRFVAPVV